MELDYVYMTRFVHLIRVVDSTMALHHVGDTWSSSIHADCVMSCSYERRTGSILQWQESAAGDHQQQRMNVHDQRASATGIQKISWTATVRPLQRLEHTLVWHMNNVCMCWIPTEYAIIVVKRKKSHASGMVRLIHSLTLDVVILGPACPAGGLSTIREC